MCATWRAKPRQASERSDRARERGESPVDQLSPGKQHKLLELMQEFGPTAEEVGTKFAGHYARMSRLVLSLAKGIDHWPTFRHGWWTATGI